MQFRLFGVPVLVQPLFWLGSVLLGLSFFHNEPRALLVWVPNVFFAVLAHEMGHALVGRRFGLDPEVHLLMLGGRTVWSSGRALTPGPSMLVSFAGPAVGLVLGGGLYLALDHLVLPPSQMLGWAIVSFLWTHLGWALFNLVPIVGLDGGNIVSAFLEKFLGARGVRWAHVLSIFVAVALATWFLSSGNLIMTFFMGLLAVDNYQRWQIAARWTEGVRPPAARPSARPSAPPADEAPLEPEIARAYEALEAGQHGSVRRIAEALVPRVRTEAQRFDVAHLVAWGRLLHGDPYGAERALRQLLPLGRRPDALLEGSLLLDSGRGGSALAPLTEALEGRGDDFVASRLARAAVAAKDVGPIVALLANPRAELDARPFQIVITELLRENLLPPAIRLGEALFARFAVGTDAFNVACAHARSGHFEAASAWLEKALGAGLPDPRVLLEDEDLRALRERPEFDALRARLEPPAAP